MSTTISYTREEMQTAMSVALGGKLSRAHLHLRFVSDLVGGQPAGREGIEAFVKYQLGLTGDDASDAVLRILNEEVQKPDPGTNEVQEEFTYGVNVLRRTQAVLNGVGYPDAAWVGTWQVRALIKQAASRLGLFQQKGKIGSKGDLSEGMLVRPEGPSACAKQEILTRDQQIVVVQEAAPFTKHLYRKFMGSVSSPKGKTSIVHDSEVAPAGCELFFSLEWPSARCKPKDMAAIWGLAERVGIGSVRSLEQGRFEVVKLEIEKGVDLDEEA